MFDKFGEFDSYMEINMVAEGLKKEGNFEGLRELAKENGLLDMAEDYINGINPELCDVITAAIGKLQTERENAKKWAALADDVVDYLSGNCDDIGFAAAVRKKGKSIEEAAKRIEEEAKKQRVSLPGGRECFYCGPMKGYQLIRDYYREGDEK